MEFAPLFTEQRWNILKCLSREPFSPMQLAKLNKTTIANISQQLRLLEAASLIKKEKMPNRDKGQPRSMFSLTGDYAYIVSLMNKFAEKKLIRLTNNQKQLLKIMSMDDLKQRELIEKAYFELLPYMSQIRAIAIDTSATNALLLVAADKITAKKLEKIEGVRLMAQERFGEHIKKSNPEQIILLHDLYKAFQMPVGEDSEEVRSRSDAEA